MFQFTDQSAWAEYGDGGSRTNDNDGAWAAARYLATLCGNNGGSLWQALREYNGSGEGANWSYQEREWQQCNALACSVKEELT